MSGERFAGTAPTTSLTFQRYAEGRVAGFRVGNGSAREYVSFAKTR